VLTHRLWLCFRFSAHSSSETAPLHILSYRQETNATELKAVSDYSTEIGAKTGT